MKTIVVATAIAAALALPALASDTTFERNLSVNGRVELSASTGSGNIHITRGSGSQVRIVGHIHGSWGADENRIKELAANPPIDQTGNIIRIGARHENLHNISISYDIEAPENSFLEASSGSGNIIDDGVGSSAKLNTGSGDIHAHGLQGGYSAETGSGNIEIEQTGSGDVKAQTGSGNIELHGVAGGLHATTGSGDISVAGSPSSPWHLETGSGNIEFSPGGSAFTLDASTGSGSVHTDQEMLVQGSQDRHHIVGKIRGGGATVRIETGSGDIRVH